MDKSFVNLLLGDYKDIIKTFEDKKDELLSEISNNVYSELVSLKPKESLAFQYTDENYTWTIYPSPTLEYAKLLVCFLRERMYQDQYEVESYVTPIVLKSVEKTITNFYSKQESIQLLCDKITEHIQQNHLIQNIARKQTVSATKIDVLNDAVKHYLKSIGMNIGSDLAHKLVDFLQSSVMQNVIHLIGQQIGTALSAAVLKQIALTIAHTINFAAIKTAIIALLKKISLTAIIKTKVGHIIVGALLSVLGLSGAGIPAAAIILPIIVGFLVYEYKTFPKKLANSVPAKLRADLSSEIPKINEDIVEDILNLVIRSLSIPFKVTDVSVANVNSKCDIITNYGCQIYSHKTQYLQPKLVFENFKEGTYDIYVKLYDGNGTLHTGNSSPSGYSYKDSVSLKNNVSNYTLSGWGGTDEGHYKAGEYRFEFYYDNVMIFTKKFNIYS